MLSATAVPWYPAPRSTVEVFTHSRLSAAAPVYQPYPPPNYAIVRTKALRAESAAGVNDSIGSTCWAPGPGMLHARIGTDCILEEEKAATELLPPRDEPTCTATVPALVPSYGKSTAGFAGSEPRVPF